MGDDVPLTERYTITLRAPLVSWATDRRSPGLAPPPAVATHLIAVLSGAHHRGRRQGILLALLCTTLPALLVVAYVLLFTHGGVR